MGKVSLFPINIPLLLREIERNAIIQALEITHGNQRKAAELLGMERTTLVMKLKRYGLREKKATA